MHSNGNGNRGYDGPERRKANSITGIFYPNVGGSGPYCGLEKGIFEAMNQPLVILNENLKVLQVNKNFYDFFRLTAEQVLGRFFCDLCDRKWNIPSLTKWLIEVLDNSASFAEFEIEHIFPGIGYKIILLSARRISQEENSRRVLLSMEDITDRKIMARELAESEELRLIAAETARHRSLLQEKQTGVIENASQSGPSDYFGKCKKIMRWNGIYTVSSFFITAIGLVIAVLLGAMITGKLERIVRPLTEIIESFSGYVK